MKTSEIPVSVRDRVIFLRKRGESYRKIGKTLNLHFATVQCIIKKYEKTGSTENQSRSGRPMALSIRDRRNIVKQAIKNPFVSARTLSNDIETASGKTVCPQTIRNILHSAGIYGRSARRKPFISETNREKRLGFARTYVNKPIEFWKQVIFSDESKFNIMTTDGKRFVWRKPNTELEAKNLRATLKHGGGNVMVWGCMAYTGVGNLAFINDTMTALSYIEVLRHNLPESAAKLALNNNYYFQQDNDPKHTALKTREWLLYNVPKQLITPPQSPDINPIENLWHLLDLKIRKTKISNKNELQRILREEWQKLSPDLTKKLVESMPRRLQAIIDAKGMHTKY